MNSSFSRTRSFRLQTPLHCLAHMASSALWSDAGYRLHAARIGRIPSALCGLYMASFSFPSKKMNSNFFKTFSVYLNKPYCGLQPHFLISFFFLHGHTVSRLRSKSFYIAKRLMLFSAREPKSNDSAEKRTVNHYAS